MGFYKILASSYRLTNIFSSKNVKKIIIFLVIGLSLFLLFSNKVFAVEDVSLIDLNGLVASGNSGTITSGNGYIEYFTTSSNYLYTVSIKDGFSLSSLGLRVSSSVPGEGVAFNTLVVLNPGQTYSFVGNDNYVFHFSANTSNMGYVNVSRSPAPGYNEAVDNMVNTFSLTNLWDQLGFAVPLIRSSSFICNWFLYCS